MNQKRIDSLRGKIPIVIDTAEQYPFDFPTDRFVVVSHALPAGDYALAGFEEDGLLIERKSSLGELCSWLFGNRERAFRELRELARARVAYIVVEQGSWADILKGNYINDVSPASVVGTINAILARYKIPTALFPSRADAAAFVAESFSQFASGLDKKFRRLAHSLWTKENPPEDWGDIAGRYHKVKPSI